MFQAPTGAGKTILAAHIVAGARRKGKRVGFLVPDIGLIDQTYATFFHEGIYEMGVIQADHPMTNWDRPIQICSVQTLANRNVEPFDIAIVDEAHAQHKSIYKLMHDPRWAKTIWIGLSATPWSRGLGLNWDKLIVVTTTAELIARHERGEPGGLSPFVVYAGSHPDLRKVKVVGDDYHQAQLSSVMRDGELIGDVVTEWLRLSPKRRTICFAVDRAHAREIQKSFEAAGVSCAYQDCFTSREERHRIREKFHADEYAVVVNIGTLARGTDWDVRWLILARPTRSEMLYVQMIGRGLRTADGKDRLGIQDHTDMTLKTMGFVTDIHHDRLCKLKRGDKKQKKDQDSPIPEKPSECPKCHVLKPSGVWKCLECGFAPERRFPVIHTDGELREISPQKKMKKPVEATRAEKIAFLAGLRAYGEKHGYKPSWASLKFKDKFGKWPSGLDWVRPSAEIDPKIASWIRHTQISWAKRNAKAMGWKTEEVDTLRLNT